MIKHWLSRLLPTRTVYVPSRRKSAHTDYEARKAETTAALRSYVAKREMGRA